MTILGIDPSTVSVGYALYDGKTLVRDGYFVPDKTSPRHTLESIETAVNGIIDGAFEQHVDLLACERMFQGPFMGERSAVLKVIPDQLRYLCASRGIAFTLISPMTIKKTVGANALMKAKGLRTKEAVYACVEKQMSAEAKALPKVHRLDVSDAHAIAITALAA